MPPSAGPTGGWAVMQRAYELYKQYCSMQLVADAALCIDKCNASARLQGALPSVNFNHTVLLYSAQSLQQCVVTPPPKAPGHTLCALVRLELWKAKGHLMLQAESLNFCFAVPVLLQDRWAADRVSDIFNNLMLHHSARWLSILFYLGIAADHVGKPSADLHCLGRHVYHESHFIVCDEQEARAVLDVPGAQLDYREEFQRGEAPWYVVLSR